MRRSWNGRSCWLVLVGGSLVAGCQDHSAARKSQVPSFPGIAIKVGAVDDAAILAGVSAAERRVGGITPRHDRDPATNRSPWNRLADVDVVLFPAQRLGDLVDAGVLAAIPNAAVLPPEPAEDERGNPRPAGSDRGQGALDDTFQYMDIAPAFREHVSRYGPERVALPCGGSALVLVYRRDAFESDANREAARRRGCRSNSRRQPGRSLTPWPGSSRAATGTATARPTTASRWRSGPTPRGSATRPFWHGPPAWGSIATIIRSCSMPTT